MLQGNTARARRLRREMSLPERLLWQQLRQRPRGLKFRRQHPSGPFVADFYCHEARAIVEIDGSAHDMGDNPAKDEERDRWFAARKLKTIRIPAEAILSDAAGMADSIAVALCPPRTGQER